MPLMHHEWARPTPDGVLLAVHIQPSAARTECAGTHGGAIKIRVAAPPRDGAANDALLRFLADHIGLPLRSVLIHSGESARRKRILLRGASLALVKERLGL